jgi:phosphoglycerol transferase
MNNSIFIGSSLICLILSLYLYKKTIISKVAVGVFYVMTYSSGLLFTAYGVINYFTGHGLDEATIYHLEYGLEGAGFLEYSPLIMATITIAILSAMFLFWFILKFKNSGNPRILNSLLLYLFLISSLVLNPVSISIYNLYGDSLSSVEQLDSGVQDSFYKYYRKPNIFATENVHKNIVFIYAESLERTYFDKSIFPGLIKGLRELEAESTYFTNIKQVVNTGWTLAGMTASQCGIPLVTPSHGNSMSGMDKFLSSAVCIGDLLNDNGYHLNYMGGASLDFAGKGKLYKTHGFTNVIGRDELLTKLENVDYQSGWGLYDDSLLEMGYNRFVDLSEAGDKFGLFLLTLDTHHPNGRLRKVVRVRSIRMPPMRY